MVFLAVDEYSPALASEFAQFEIETRSQGKLDILRMNGGEGGQTKDQGGNRGEFYRLHTWDIPPTRLSLHFARDYFGKSSKWRSRAACAWTP